MEEEKTIYLIDGTAYIHRAYHAIRGLTNSSGLPTNAVFGFTRMLIKLLSDRSPAYIGMFFDAKGPTFRHEMYSAYKANRPSMPEDMAIQIPYIREVARAMRLPVFEMPGYEADDVIGTIANQAESAGFSVVMVTGDKDFMQLVTEKISIWDPMKEKTIDYDSVRNTYGLDPKQLIDVMGLSGDTSDNVPGVPGIGEKTALSLIQSFGGMEALYDALNTVSQKKQREKLGDYKEQAFLSKKLVTIHRDVPVSFDPAAFCRQEPDREKLQDLFKTLEFSQLQQVFFAPTPTKTKAYKAVCDIEALTALITRLKSAPVFALDTETTSKDPMNAELVGLSFAVQVDEGFYIPCGHDADVVPNQLDRNWVLDLLKPILENNDLKKVGQNIKYDWMVLSHYGIELAGVVFDTMLASYLLNPSKRAHNLDQIALDYLNHHTITYEETVGKANKADGFARVPLEKAVPYAGEDADITLAAYEVLAPKLKNLGLWDLFQQVEMPLVPVLVRMERRGIQVSPDRLMELSKTFAQQLDELEAQIYALAGERFNIRSSQQLGQIFFEKLKLPVQKKTKKKTNYSTDVDVLTALADHHELPAYVLRHRTLAKLKSTYADALIDLIHPKTGRIHTSYNQTITATGRLSSSDPNLQNIPIRTEEGRQIRSAFLPRKGWRLLSADYSQIELRILAHCSEDPILIEAFLNDEDIHTRTAAEVFQVFPSFIDADLRRQAKAINFGIVYGMSPFGLSRQLGISQKMAKTYIDNYFARYRGVKAFMDRTIAEAHTTRKTTTLLNRIRLLPDIDSTNLSVRQFAERTAINTPIQGSAADLIKLAMIKADETLRQKGMETAMLLTVHDELVFEVPPEEETLAEELVRGIMEGVWALRVPLKVNMEWGDNWAQVH
ncbi:MAG: DNA polymerase I [Desulfobacterales bacterium]|jgi:DNA polymerase-1|nr:DNA polymerase I [Desulfobacterales bacterium]